MSDPIRVSILCPVFEEGHGLLAFHRALAEVLDTLEHCFAFEILFIDDGSQDETLDILRELAHRDGRVRYLSLTRNFGKEAALFAGMVEASGEAVFLIDGDLQHPPELLPEFLHRWREGYDVIIGRHLRPPHAGWFKRWASRWFRRVFHAATTTPLADSDFQLLSRRVVDALLRCRETHRLQRGLVGWLGFPSIEVPFRAPPRRCGTTRYGSLRLASLAGDALLSFSRWPLRLALLLGLLLLVLAPLGLLTAACHHAFAGRTPWPLVLLLTGTSLLHGLVLFCVGILGEYVGRIYQQVKGRPLYLVKESSTEPTMPLPMRRRLQESRQP